MLTEIIESLHDDEEWYVIDYLPVTMVNPIYFDIEEYFMRTYLKNFAKKISRIIIKLIGYYPVQICLTEFPKKRKDPLKKLYPIEKNLWKMPFAELDKILTHVIINDISSVQIVFGNNPYSLISVTGGFSVTAFRFKDEQLNILERLVKQEGLFLRHIRERGQRLIEEEKGGI